MRKIVLDSDLFKKYYYDDKLTLREIAQLFNVSQNRVSREVAILGLGKRRSIYRPHVRKTGHPKTSIKVGDIVGSLEVVAQTEDVRGYTTFNCKCNHCGGILYSMYPRAIYSRNKDIIGCKHCRHKLISKANWSGRGDISSSHWSNIKRAAKKRNLDISISIEDVWQLYLRQDGRCAITGVSIGFTKTHKDRSDATASLDRIDSSKGYIKDNVQWVHKIVNRMKWNLPDEEFIYWCRLIVEHKDKS